MQKIFLTQQVLLSNVNKAKNKKAILELKNTLLYCKVSLKIKLG